MNVHLSGHSKPQQGLVERSNAESTKKCVSPNSGARKKHEIPKSYTQTHRINNVLLVKIEGPVWLIPSISIYHHLPVVEGGSSETPFF